jgi:hypothetical protein
VIAKSGRNFRPVVCSRCGEHTSLLDIIASCA